MNISFALTTDQFRNRTKTVTRRIGWKSLKAGDILCGCVKCQGLKPGEKIDRLGLIRVISARRESLDAIDNDGPYAASETTKEGFPDMKGEEFVTMFCKHVKCRRSDIVTRIEFEYLDSKEPNQ